jgi:hypothetical protein
MPVPIRSDPLDINILFNLARYLGTLEAYLDFEIQLSTFHAALLSTGLQGSISSDRKLDRIGSEIGSDRIGNPKALSGMDVEWDPLLLWIAESECDPKNPDRSQACISHGQH